MAFQVDWEQEGLVGLGVGQECGWDRGGEPCGCRILGLAGMPLPSEPRELGLRSKAQAAPALELSCQAKGNALCQLPQLLVFFTGLPAIFKVGKGTDQMEPGSLKHREVGSLVHGHTARPQG